MGQASQRSAASSTGCEELLDAIERDEKKEKN